MPFLCQYKNIFGTPGTGVHQARFLGLARTDTLGTIAIAIIITYFTTSRKDKLLDGWKILRTFITTFIVIFALGELLHWVFCVDTAFISWLRHLA